MYIFESCDVQHFILQYITSCREGQLPVGILDSEECTILPAMAIPNTCGYKILWMSSHTSVTRDPVGRGYKCIYMYNVKVPD